MTERSRCPECGGPTPADILRHAREFVRNTPEGEHPDAVDFADFYIRTIYREKYVKPAGQPGRIGQKQRPRKRAA